jgi:hypothetical protein
MPAKSHTTPTLAGGTVHECFVIDTLTVGVSASCESNLRSERPLAIGCCVGRVARVFHSSVAVKFVELQNQCELERLVIRPLRYQGRGLRGFDWDDDEAEPQQASA